MEDALPGLIPSIAAIIAAAIVVLISNMFSEPYQKIMFQFSLFGVGFAVGLGALVSVDDPLESARLYETWRLFAGLSWNTRFLLTLVMIGATYFGAGMYIAAPERTPEGAEGDEGEGAGEVAYFRTPASCDNVVGFTIPDNVNAKDKEFFESFLDRYRDKHTISPPPFSNSSPSSPPPLLLDRLQKEIVSDLPTVYEMPNEAVKYVDRMIAYTVAGGKMNRGLSVLDSHAKLIEATRRKVTPKARVQAAALGWCVEFLQAFFLVADDVMDGSLTRRGNPCWYKLPDVSLVAINDSFILESCVYKILKRYFGKERYYYQLVDLFIEVTRQTEMGQLLDLTSQPMNGPLDLSRYTIERYRSIVKYKTAFYSFYLPVALGMVMAGINDPHLYQQAKKILCIMGEYFQIQDDYLDCYGSPEVIGKVGTDIQDKKCSWLVVKALDQATPAQRKVLEDNYGQHDMNKVQKIKDLYNEMGLEEQFKQYEEESFAELNRLIGEVKSMPKDVFEFLLKKIYKRSK